MNADQNPAVDGSITGQPFDVFTARMSADLYSDDEIAGWIRANSPDSAQRAELTAAVQKIRNTTAVPAVIRNSLRALKGEPPIEGEFEV